MNKPELQNAVQADERVISEASAPGHWLSRTTVVVALVTAAALIAGPANARWYKWVDEDGNISYQDRPPPSNFENSTQVLSQQGVTLETIPSSQEQAKLDRQAKLKQEKRQRDDALLRAFPRESDLTNTRDARVVHVDGAIARMYDQMVILNTRLISIEDRIEQRVERNLSPSDALESDRLAVVRSIDNAESLIRSKLRERREIIAQFDRDLYRYRELSHGSTATATYND